MFKKLICFCFAVIIIFSCSTTALAKKNKDDDDDDGGFSISGIIDGFKNAIEDIFPKASVEENDFREQMAEGSTSGFNLITTYLTNNEQVFMFIDGARVTQVLLRVLTRYGYLVLLVCWCIENGKSAIELDLYEVKGFIKVGVRILAGVVLLRISSQLLSLISILSNKITSKILEGANLNIIEELGTKFNSIEMYAPDPNIPILGWFIQLYQYHVAQAPINLFNICLFVVSQIMAISLGIRIIKLAIYQGTSPMFFGLVACKNTSRYFQNFIVQYCVISLQIVFIAAIYTAFQIAYVNYFRSTQFSGDFTWGAFAYGFVIMCVFCVMILKSDKLFEKVFH